MIGLINPVRERREPQPDADALGFHGASNDELRAKLEHVARRRREDFAKATHFVIFGEGGEVQLTRLGG